MARKVIQISSCMQEPIVVSDGRKFEEELNVVALCDDGTLWRIQADLPEATWVRLPDIPQK